MQRISLVFAFAFVIPSSNTTTPDPWLLCALVPDQAPPTSSKGRSTGACWPVTWRWRRGSRGSSPRTGCTAPRCSPIRPALTARAPRMAAGTCPTTRRTATRCARAPPTWPPRRGSVPPLQPRSGSSPLSGRSYWPSAPRLYDGQEPEDSRRWTDNPWSQRAQSPRARTGGAPLCLGARTGGAPHWPGARTGRAPHWPGARTGWAPHWPRARTGGAPHWPGARGTLCLIRQRKCVLLHCIIMLLIFCYLFTIPFDGLKMTQNAFHYPNNVLVLLNRKTLRHSRTHLPSVCVWNGLEIGLTESIPRAAVYEGDIAWSIFPHGKQPEF